MSIKDSVLNIIFSEFEEDYILSLYDSFDIDSIDVFQDLGYDSIRFITMIVELESRFHIELPDQYLSMDDFGKIGTIVDIIETLIGEYE